MKTIVKLGTKVRDNLKYCVSKEISIVFHNGFTYDYHFIIKELAEEFEGQFICLGKNTVKYIIFSVTIGKQVTRIDKKGKEITKTISYILQFINSVRFMTSSLNLVNNLTAGIHIIKYKYGHDDKKFETCGINYKNCECCLERKDSLIEYKCCDATRIVKKKFDENLKKRSANTYQSFNHDINKFILLLRKVLTHINIWMIAKNSIKLH